MIQNIITYIIVAIAVIHVMYGFYKTFLVKGKKSACQGCSRDCQLKKKTIKNTTLYY